MKKILMIILDGFGIREEEHGNAVKLANMSFFKKDSCCIFENNMLE